METQVDFLFECVRVEPVFPRVSDSAASECGVSELAPGRNFGHAVPASFLHFQAGVKFVQVGVPRCAVAEFDPRCERQQVGFDIRKMHGLPAPVARLARGLDESEALDPEEGKGATGGPVHVLAASRWSGVLVAVGRHGCHQVPGAYQRNVHAAKQVEPGVLVRGKRRDGPVQFTELQGQGHAFGPGEGGVDAGRCGIEKPVLRTPADKAVAVHARPQEVQISQAGRSVAGIFRCEHPEEGLTAVRSAASVQGPLVGAHTPGVVNRSVRVNEKQVRAQGFPKCGNSAIVAQESGVQSESPEGHVHVVAEIDSVLHAALFLAFSREEAFVIEFGQDQGGQLLRLVSVTAFGHNGVGCCQAGGCRGAVVDVGETLAHVNSQVVRSPLDGCPPDFGLGLRETVLHDRVGKGEHQ